MNYGHPVLKIFLFLLVGATLSSCGAFDKLGTYFKSDKKFDAETLERLKNTTTIFFLREQDDSLRTEYEEAIESAWDYTDIKVVSYLEADKLEKGNYSYFAINAISRAIYHGEKYMNSETYITLKLKLRYTGLDKKGREREYENEFSRVELYPNFETANAIIKKDYNVDSFYRESTFYNWTPAHMHVYLKRIQKDLEESRARYNLRSFKNEKELHVLKNHTLYVPKHILIKFNPIGGSEKKRHDPDNLFSKYPYNYKIVNANALYEGIMNGEVQYVLDYTKSSSDSYIRVYDLQNGLLYQSYRPVRYNIKPKFIKHIIK